MTPFNTPTWQFNYYAKGSGMAVFDFHRLRRPCMAFGWAQRITIPWLIGQRKNQKECFNETK